LRAHFVVEDIEAQPLRGVDVSFTPGETNPNPPIPRRRCRETPYWLMCAH